MRNILPFLIGWPCLNLLEFLIGCNTLVASIEAIQPMTAMIMTRWRTVDSIEFVHWSTFCVECLVVGRSVVNFCRLNVSLSNILFPECCEYALAVPYHLTKHLQLDSFEQQILIAFSLSPSLEKTSSSEWCSESSGLYSFS